MVGVSCWLASSRNVSKATDALPPVLPSAKYHVVLGAGTPSASCPAAMLPGGSKYIARSATMPLPDVSDSTIVENSARASAGCSVRGQKVTRLFGAATCSVTSDAPVDVRYVARTRVCDALGLATSTNVSNALVAPSARIHDSAGCTTPLALWPPVRLAPGKYIDRSTTTSAGVEVPATTAETCAEALPFRPKWSVRLTVSLAVGGSGNTFVSTSQMASGWGSSCTVTSSAWAEGLATRISPVNSALFAPSARNHVDAPCAATTDAAPSTRLMARRNR